jgi:hypothetical protein
MMKYDPEDWLESSTRCLEEYARESFHQAIKSEDGTPIGLEAYEIVMQFPGTLLDTRKVPMRRTLIHFEIDEIATSVIGFGDNIFAENFNETDESLNPQWAAAHRLNIDIGIWASDASGGITSRAKVKQILVNAFGGAAGIVKLREYSDGGDGRLDILSFSGGRFLVDRVNDVTVYRMVECTLEIGVFSRTPIEDTASVPAIMFITQDPKLSISSEDIPPPGPVEFGSTATVVDNFAYPDGDLYAASGGIWNPMQYEPKVEGGQFRAGDVDGALSQAWHGPSSVVTDVDVYATVAVWDDWAMVMARINDTGTKYGFQASAANSMAALVVWAYTTPTVLATVTGLTLDPGDKIGIRCLGTKISGYVFHAGSWTEVCTADDAQIPGGNGGVGLSQGNADTAGVGRIDDFAVGFNIVPT